MKSLYLVLMCLFMGCVDTSVTEAETELSGGNPLDAPACTELPEDVVERISVARTATTSALDVSYAEDLALGIEWSGDLVQLDAMAEADASQIVVADGACRAEEGNQLRIEFRCTSIGDEGKVLVCSLTIVEDGPVITDWSWHATRQPLTNKWKVVRQICVSRARGRAGDGWDTACERDSP